MAAVCEGKRGAVPAAAAGALVPWAKEPGRHQAGGPARGGLRFMFYGRVSTEDWQEPVTSRARQREQAEALVRGHGVIVAEFFDAGQSRTVAWGRRPEAALVALLADPDRGWDAIVVGEYERAFYGSQYAAMAPLFEHYGVGLWMPEAGGRVDFASEHDEHDDLPWPVFQAGGDPDQHPGADRDGGPGAGPGPVPGRPAAVRVPAG
ncbi:MAG TPA: recombinase family protein [Streptosporangiaceae bacterium]|nr:recombinase family protein [Streptosporangiaceae bacterium]